MTVVQNGEFNKSNWSRTAINAKAVQYLPAAKGGIAQPTTVTANGVLTTTVNLAFQFKGNGPVEVSLPFGQQLITSASAAAANLSLGEAWISGAIAATGYAQGVHPYLTYKLVNSTSSAITTGACDLLVTQY